jgi:hypothetical protein
MVEFAGSASLVEFFNRRRVEIRDLGFMLSHTQCLGTQRVEVSLRMRGITTDRTADRNKAEKE